ACGIVLSHTLDFAQLQFTNEITTCSTYTSYYGIVSVKQMSNLSDPIISPFATCSRLTIPPHLLDDVMDVEFNVYVTRKTFVEELLRYREGAIIEYPRTSSTGSIGHLFKVPAEQWTNPSASFAYAQGSPRGRSPRTKPVFCNVLRDSIGNMVPCQESHSTCQGCKICPRASDSLFESSHTFATRQDIKNRLRLDREQHALSATPLRTVFERTLSRIAAYRKYGCGAAVYGADGYLNESDEVWVDHLELRAAHEKARRGYQPSEQVKCGGRLLFMYDFDGEPFLHIRDGSYDLEYLEAVLTNNYDTVSRLEALAEMAGYGPLSPCNTLVNFTSNRVHCPCEHRDDNDCLIPQEMLPIPCKSRLQVFEPLPEYRDTCPYVLVVCTHEHSHPVPLPTKTPAHIRKIIFDLLVSVGQELPDLTPRRFLRHSVVQAQLRDLLPHSYIKQAKNLHFPDGTGWNGLRHWKHIQDTTFKPEDIYVRYMAEFPSSHALLQLHAEVDEASECEEQPNLRVVICMTPAQSWRLLRAQYLQSDIAFKRVSGYKEFELGGWDHENRTAIIFCRVLLTRETAEVHRFIFDKIDEIVKADTGSMLQWRHLHSASLDQYVGVLQLTADQHLGQAKGFGLYLWHRAQALPPTPDLHEPDRPISSLSPYEHLHRIFRLCTVHVFRNIKTSPVADDVKALMRSLVCLEHEDWEGTIEAIREQGGRVAANWIEDKLRSKFAFEGMCWEKSFIPQDIWQAGERHSNLIESQHADANREGTKCSLLGGIVRGRHLDVLKIKTLVASEDVGVRPSFQIHDGTRKAFQALKRQQKGRRKAHISQDTKILSVQKQLTRKTKALDAARRRLHTRVTSGSRFDAAKAERAVVNAKKAYTQAVENAAALMDSGSGRITTSIVPLVERGLHE
ncbi:hypothetical protein POSPLADRAFT_1161553, partial [Postia placenta MAD-698-R-SB12]